MGYFWLTVGGPGTTLFDGGKTVGIFPVTVAMGPNLSKLQTVGYFLFSVDRKAVVPLGDHNNHLMEMT